MGHILNACSFSCKCLSIKNLIRDDVFDFGLILDYLLVLTISFSRHFVLTYNACVSRQAQLFTSDDLEMVIPSQ